MRYSIKWTATVVLFVVLTVDAHECPPKIGSPCVTWWGNNVKQQGCNPDGDFAFRLPAVAPRSPEFGKPYFVCKNQTDLLPGERECTYTRYPDGGMYFTGTVHHHAEPRWAFDVDVFLPAFGFQGTSGTPYLGIGQCQVDIDEWEFWSYVQGHLRGIHDYEGGMVRLDVGGYPPFQSGMGGNNKNSNFGASSWFDTWIDAFPVNTTAGSSWRVSDKWRQGDINIDMGVCEFTLPDTMPPSAQETTAWTAMETVAETAGESHSWTAAATAPGTASHTVAETAPETAVATAYATADWTQAAPEECECSDELTGVRLLLSGDSCATMSHNQAPGSVWCSGSLAPGVRDVFVRVVCDIDDDDDEDDAVDWWNPWTGSRDWRSTWRWGSRWNRSRHRRKHRNHDADDAVCFEGVVTIGDAFEWLWNQEIGDTLTLYIDAVGVADCGMKIKFMLPCAQPVTQGDVFGPVTLLGLSDYNSPNAPCAF